MAYYRNAGMLREQLTRIAALPDAFREHIEVVICDDGSPDGDAKGFDIGCPLSIYKTEVDVRWNQDSARNICAHHAKSPWLLLTDMDHLVPAETWQFLIANKLKPATVYRFSRTTLNPDMSITPYKEHPNSWLMTRGMYWKIGGYDERYAGFYGSDAMFRNAVQRTAPAVEMLTESITRVPRETIPDASTTTYKRKEKGVDDVGIPRIRAEIARLPLSEQAPKTLTFPYRRIY